MKKFKTTYDLVIEIRPEYVYAKVTAAEISIAGALDYLEHIFAKCQEYGSKRLMLERDIPPLKNDEEA